MKRRYLLKGIVFVLGFSLLCAPITAMAEEKTPSTVRVGLEYKYKNVNSVPITNSVIVLGSDINGQFMSEATLKSVSAFSVVVPSSYYVVAGKGLTTYDEAVSMCGSYSNYGGTAVPAYMGPKSWGIYICGFTSQAEANSTSAQIGGASVIAPSAALLELRDGNTPVIVADGIHPQIGPGEGEFVTLGDRSYRGVIEFGRYVGSAMTAVNVIGLEEYLYGVVPSEMPAAYDKEALKAQACAARTYALEELKSHIESGYELCDGVNCQVYNGVTNETASTTAAVQETAGQLIYYNGEIINAVFFSNSGGYTENSENVWPNSLDYLKAVPEISEVETKAWSRTFTTGDIDALLTASGANIGSVQDIVISEISSSGRIQKLDIVGSDGTKSLTKEDIRSFFAGKGGSLDSRMFTINGKGGGSVKGVISIESPKVSVPIAQNSDSTVAIMTAGNSTSAVTLPGLIEEDASKNIIEVKDVPIPQGNTSGTKTATAKPAPPTSSVTTSTVSISTSNGTGSYLFEGYGSGHGVGMSQKGAWGMARMGYSYIDILKHYYTGVEVK